MSVEDPRNTLTARGPQASLDALGRLIAEIDVPLEQVEIEMPLVEMTREEAKKLGLKFPNSVGLKGDVYAYAAVMLAPASVSTSAINQLVVTGRAKIINDPRLAVLSGLTGRIQSTERRSAMLDFDYKEAPKGLAPGVAFISSSTGLTCGVEIVADMVNLQAQVELNNTTSEIVTTIRDNQTLAIRLSSFDPNSPTVRIAFLTARIIRRALDNVAVPGR